MKRTLVAMIALLSGVFAFGQKYTLGQFVEVDGIPAVVISVDESGEHGLMISAPANRPEWNTKKLWTGDVPKKEVDAAFQAYPKADCTKEGWIFKIKKSKELKEAEKLWMEVANDLWDRLGTDGETNTAMIKQYSAEKGCAVGKYFPWVEWALNLGEGWYSPGSAEVNNFATYYNPDGIGFKYAKSMFKWQARAKELSGGDERAASILEAYGMGGIISSSLVKTNEKTVTIKPYNLVSTRNKMGFYWFQTGWWSYTPATSHIAAFRKF